MSRIAPTTGNEGLQPNAYTFVPGRQFLALIQEIVNAMTAPQIAEHTRASAELKENYRARVKELNQQTAEYENLCAQAKKNQELYLNLERIAGQRFQ